MDPPLLQDLKVTIQNTCVVLPSQEIEKKSMFLSNPDQVLNFDVATLHFFESNIDFTPQVVAQKLKTTLETLLVSYNFMAGRLKQNPETSRLEIDCNGAGIVFVVASSEYSLDEIGELVYPNPAFEQLIISKDMACSGNDDKPLCIFQVTSFKCGGFAMGILNNHTLLDGIGFKTFLENLAVVAADKPLVVTPCNDRHLLAARSPPRVTFPHPELLKLNLPPSEGSNASIFDAAQEALDFKIFKLTAGDISNLKEKAKSSADARVSSFNAMTAHIWRCKALSLGKEEDLDRMSTLLYAVNIRPRLIPPLPASYVGNAVISAYASATCRELKEEPLSKLVEMVSEGAKRVNDEYARSVIDWMEINKGIPYGEFVVSSWCKLGLDEVEYPWGRPRNCCPLVCPRKNIILFFPDTTDKDCVNVLAALPSNEMDKFQNLFHTFLFA